MKTLRSILSAFLSLLLMSVFPSVHVFGKEARSLAVSAESAVLLEADSGSIVWSKDPTKRLPMASTTKIMSALTAIENGDLDREVHVAAEAVGVEGS